MPYENICSRVKYEENSGEDDSAWICGVWSSSAKTKVFGAEVARVMRSAAARGDVADLERARNGYYDVVRLDSLEYYHFIDGTAYFECIQGFCLFHFVQFGARYSSKLAKVTSQTKSLLEFGADGKRVQFQPASQLCVFEWQRQGSGELDRVRWFVVVVVGCEA